MKALLINGSSRGTGGITGRLLQSFRSGFLSGNNEAEMINLSGLTFGHCRSCFSCMHDSPGVCRLDDDMKKIYPELKTSDLLVIGTPLYTDSMSSLTKAFFDRCICSMEPFIHEDDNGRFRHSFNWKMPAKFILLSTSGFPERENFKPLSETVRAQAYNFGSVFSAEILIPGSIAFQMDRSLLEHRLELVREAGIEIGTKGMISRELAGRIIESDVSGDEYLRSYKKYEKWCRERLGRFSDQERS